MILNNKIQEKGSIDIWMITTISLIVLVIGIGAFAIWSFTNYNEQKTDVDSKISIATAAAEKEQADNDEVKFAQREKELNRAFSGPEDYGLVGFNYPKTWSVYLAEDATSGGTFEAYFNPVYVPAISTSQQYALHITIEQEDYDKALAGFDEAVKKGDLNSSTVTIGGTSGVRLDGTFSEDIRGSMVLFKIRDKVVTIRTDSDVFKPDFDALIPTITFNQ